MMIKMSRDDWNIMTNDDEGLPGMTIEDLKDDKG